MKAPFFAFSLGLLAASGSSSPAVTYFLSQPYYGRSDSPFYQGILAGTIYIDDFEDRQLNTPYVSSPWGGTSPEPSGRTVDEDDGKDGKTTTGGFAWEGRGGGRDASLRFLFAPNDKDQLPEYFGVALMWGNTATVGLDEYTDFLVFDAMGREVTGGWHDLKPRIPRGTPGDSSAYDRFAGIYVPGGISRVDILNNSVVDHLQYGYSIPEPGAAALAAMAAAFPLAGRRRRKSAVSQSPTNPNRVMVWPTRISPAPPVRGWRG